MESIEKLRDRIGSLRCRNMLVRSECKVLCKSADEIEAENYHPNGNYLMRCCNYFDSYNDEVNPDGFCSWGERRGQ